MWLLSFFLSMINQTTLLFVVSVSLMQFGFCFKTSFHPQKHIYHSFHYILLVCVPCPSVSLVFPHTLIFSPTLLLLNIHDKGCNDISMSQYNNTSVTTLQYAIYCSIIQQMTTIWKEVQSLVINQCASDDGHTRNDGSCSSNFTLLCFTADEKLPLKTYHLKPSMMTLRHSSHVLTVILMIRLHPFLLLSLFLSGLTLLLCVCVCVLSPGLEAQQTALLLRTSVSLPLSPALMHRGTVCALGPINDKV